MSTRDPSTHGKVERDPETCGGDWRIAGTRITTRQVAQMHEESGSAWILSEYPSLVEADIESAVAHEAEGTGRRKAFARETDLARIVAEHYRRSGARVWAEVDIGINERPDLVVVDAVLGLVVIECKLQVSFGAIAQAALWWEHANMAVLAVPYSERLQADAPESNLVRRICEHEGIGLLGVSSQWSLIQIVRPEAHRSPIDIGILDALQRLPEYDPATATVHPGSPGRPEKPELMRARNYLEGLAMDWDRRKISYYSREMEARFGQRIARQVIAQAKNNKVDGVKAERIGGMWFLGPAESSEEEVA